jgi:hypothetical protein
MTLTADTLLLWATEAVRLAHAIRRLQAQPEDRRLLEEEQHLADVVLDRVLQLARMESEN